MPSEYTGELENSSSYSEGFSKWRSPSQKIKRNTQSGGEQTLWQQAFKELNEEFGWPIRQLCEIAGMTRDGYYKWLKRKASRYQDEQSKLLETILKLEQEHNWTLGYLAMTTQLKFENCLSFTAIKPHNQFYLFTLYP